jgi:hypothetical protein
VSRCPHHASRWEEVELRQCIVFFSPPLLKKHIGIAKNQRSLVICSLNQIRYSLFWLQYIWFWILYWTYFVFQFHHFIFILSLVFIMLIVICFFFLYSFLIESFFQFYPSHFDFIFFVKFSPYSFQFDFFPFVILFFCWIYFFNFIYNYFSWLGIILFLQFFGNESLLNFFYLLSIFFF